MARPVTLAVVAEHAGVSRQTVSNALNAPGKLRPETLRRVQESIAALGYQPDRHARSLRTRAAGALGLGLRLAGTAGLPGTTGLGDRFLTALCQATEASGRDLVVFAAPPGRRGLSALEERLRQGVVDGFVLADPVPGDVRHAWLARREVPFVSVGRIWTGAQPGPWVDTDHAAATDTAVRHLHSQGHRRIGLLAYSAPGPSAPGYGALAERVAGWRRACGALGLRDGEELVAWVDGEDTDAVAAGLVATTRLLATASPQPGTGPGSRPSAIVAVTDELALGALHAIAAHGLRPGLDVAVIGVGDSPVCVATRPALTTVRLPLEDMARWAIRLLDGAAVTGLGAAQGLLLPPLLVERASTGPFRDGAVR